MKKIILLTLLVFACFLFGCASGSNGIITSSKDTIDGKRKWEKLVLIPKGMSFDTTKNMGLNIVRVTTNGKLTAYYFEAEIHTNNWIFIESITLKINDTKYRLTDDDPDRVVKSGNYVIERLNIIISQDILKKIKEADTITAELHNRVEIINPEILQKMKEFITVDNS